MKDLLDNQDESLPPREKWIRENAVKSFFSEGHEKLQGQYKAVSGKYEAIGGTRDEAIERLAQMLWIKEGVPIWTMK